MKPGNKIRRIALLTLLPLSALFALIVFSSFEMNRFGDEFLKQLGISKKDCDERISGSILGGGLNYYGAKNLKNIATGNRKAVALDLLDYTKKYVAGPEFAKLYLEMKNRYKPEEPKVETPEESRANEIARWKEAVKSADASLAKADPQFREIFKNAADDARKGLKQAEDPNNKQQARYKANYPKLVEDLKKSHQANLADWEAKYPSNPQLFVKKRLAEFMKETEDVDFDAETVLKNGKKYFVKPEYERKGSRWKQAYRAGRDVVTTSREFVSKWMAEIR